MSPARRRAWSAGPAAALIGGLFTLLMLAAAPALAAPKFPALTGRVVDDAHMLSAPAKAALTAKLTDLEARTTRQLVVVTLPSLQGYPIEEFGYQLGRAWGIGQKADPSNPKTEKDNGVLFIVAPSERSVRIEVGYGLEPILTDALSSAILQGQVLPKFRAGDMSGGVLAGADALIDQLALPADQAAQRVRQAASRTGQASGDEGFGRLVPFFILALVLISMFGRRRRGGLGWIAPIILGGLSSRGRDDRWGGGGWGGGGGGFGGGGGGFGGGGSSGRW